MTRAHFLAAISMLPFQFAVNAQPDPARYIVQSGDKLYVRVWRRPHLNTHVTVAADNSVELPVIGRISVRGRSTVQLASDIKQKYEDQTGQAFQVMVLLTQLSVW